MYERHGEHHQFGSNRYRDLADLLLISQQETVAGEAVCRALRREAERRRHNGLHIVLPAIFETPGSDWTDGYPKQAALVTGLNGCGTYKEATQAAAAFISPMLASTGVGTWNPHTATWA